ncbi:MAG TPA: class I SAM-dependent methyltransferase [Candidatus Nanoarchaeia archaeon]|nr:class I SAM-dependent methyltransferase [Candidatus Nanoarchaeia archaeon]
MYQSGIYNISQLSADLKTIPFIATKPVAIDLYAQTRQLNPEQRQAAEERILNFAFSDGSYKKTHSRRFDDFDDQVIAYLQKNLDRGKKYKFHDLAVSDGRTSRDFYLQLEKIFPALDYYASDKNMFVDIFPDRKNKIRRIAKDEKGKILQIILPPFVLNIYSPKRALRFKIKKAILYPINLILAKLLLWPPALELFIKIDPAEKRRIALISGEARELAATKNNFHLQSFDLFQKSPDKFDLIRAMNVLNISYFTPAEVKKIAANIFASLAEGGLFIVGSNLSAGTPVNGDLLLKKNGQWQSVLKFGRGTNFREIILSAQAAG